MARSNGGNGGSFFDLDIQVVSTSDTSYTLRAVIYLTSQNVSDGVNELSVTGWWSRSGALALGGAYSNTPVWSSDIVVNRQYGTGTYVEVSASWSGVEFWGTTLSATQGYTVPARPYDKPAAPTSISVSRVSDTQHTVSWAATSTSSAPIETQVVYRSTDGGGWASIAAVGDSVRSYTDTTTSADHDYRYMVHTSNSSGSLGTGPVAGPIQTTPAAPTSVSAVKNASNGVVVSWTNASRLTPITWRVERSSNGGAWTALTTAQAQGTTSYTDAAPDPAQTHKYRVRAESTEGASTQSAFVESGTVQLAAPPAAPTGLGPTTPRPATDPITLTWTHNPVDSSPQRQYQNRRRKVGAATWVESGIVTSSTSSQSFTPSNVVGGSPSGWGVLDGETWEWQIRTWGQHADPSPWSATATTKFSARPTATIAVPGATVAASRLTVEWAYYDAESTAQAAWEVQILSGGTVVETRTGPGDASSALLNTVLVDGGTYTARVRVRDGDGLWSAYAEQAFTVAYALPPAPSVGAPVWDPDTATVTVTIDTPPHVTPQVPAVSVDLYRSIDGGPWTLVAGALPIQTTVVDHAPTVAGVNTYRADAVSALPSVATSAAVAVTTPQAGDPPASVWLSGGPDLSVVCRAMSNVALTSRSGRAEKVLHRFAGRALPVEFTGEGAARSWGLAFDIIRGSGLPGSTAQQWLDLADLPGPHLLRSPDHYRWVSLSDVDVNRGVGGVVSSVSFTATEVDRD